MTKSLHSFILLLTLMLLALPGWAQIVRLEPAGAGPDEPAKLIFDAKLGGAELANATKVYAHSGVVTESPNGTAWTNVKGNWGADDGIGQMTAVAGQNGVWELNLTPTVRAYYGVADGVNIYRLSMVFRNADGSQKATMTPGTYDWGFVAANGDMYVNLATGPYVHIARPQGDDIFLQQGSSFQIQAEASAAVTSMTVFVKEGGSFVQKHQVSSGKTISYNYTPAQSGAVEIKVVAVIDGTSVESLKTVQLYQHQATQTAALPAGMRKGINYRPQDPTKVTLVLEAPGKSFVYVVGDFNNWQPQSQYQMKKTADGRLFWLEVSGLTAAREYVFQYWVDGNIKIGDPYADKVADPWNDQYIGSSTYPALPEYSRTEWGVASVLQTGQQPYQWAASEASWTKPAQSELVIYELLIRDFTDTHLYKDVTAKLPYLKSLGVNAIELMPVMEFEGNVSWGYNPMYHFAPDKYYGTKNDLKEFIEAAHQQGMAVILDMVLNHAFGQSPLVKMYWDDANNTVTANSPWFNPQATHPFNVGYDFNHESAYTKSFVDSVNLYWMEEYHFDGFRFDLSKGFTQTPNPDNVGAWSNYDASRVAILKRMADRIWQHTPDAYVILEHFAENREEKELAEYRANEGKGMLLWGNLNHAYNQNTMGFAAESDISWVYHGRRNWTVPHVIGYMESHDEERLMYKNLQFGNSSGSYSIKNKKTALERVKAASLMFYTVPGPKMLWQFGELGFDLSINRCEDGTVNNNCRLSPKPPVWEYQNDADRQSLFDYTADLIRLKNTYEVFNTGTASFGGSGLQKQITILNAANTQSPASAQEMSVLAVSNFDLNAREFSIIFPHAGTWYDYYNGGQAVEIASGALSVQLGAGQYKLYTNYPIEPGVVAGLPQGSTVGLQLYPNPTQATITLGAGLEKVQAVSFRSLQGISVYPRQLSQNQWDVSNLPAGFYVVTVKVGGKHYFMKMVRH